jgi:hypothetical protein
MYTLFLSYVNSTSKRNGFEVKEYLEWCVPAGTFASAMIPPLHDGTHGGARQALSALGGEPGEYGQPRAALGDREQAAAMALAEDGIEFPVADAAAALHLPGTLFDADPVRQPPLAAGVSVALLSEPLAAQLPIQQQLGLLECSFDLAVGEAGMLAQLASRHPFIKVALRC